MNNYLNESLSSTRFHVSEQEFDMYHIALSKRANAARTPRLPTPVQNKGAITDNVTSNNAPQAINKVITKASPIKNKAQYQHFSSSNKPLKHLQLMAQIRNDIFPTAKVTVEGFSR